MYHKTVDEMLAAWDAGETIWSLEMGGLGPGYEQALQIAAVEFARELRNYVPTGDEKKDNEAAHKICAAKLHLINEGLLGLSGAQYDVAKWLAWQWCHKGGSEGMAERAKEKGERDRLIQVSKHWPKCPGEPDLRCPVPELKDAIPLVLYFGNDADREEFIELFKQARPNMVFKKL